jgi:hypothetical protein
MDQLNPPELSPYQTFSEAEWAGLRADTPMTLTDDEIEALQGFNDRVEPGQVESIYLPLSRLLSLYVEAAQGLHAATSRFLGHSNGKSTPGRAVTRLVSPNPFHHRTGQTVPWSFAVTGPRPLKANFWTRFPSYVSVV